MDSSKEKHRNIKHKIEKNANISFNMNLFCNGCGLCCLETEMILTKNDIKRIYRNCSNFIDNGKFFHFQNGFKMLKNIKHHCYFFNFETKRCKIYNFRPQGCRIYPMIFDETDKICILDDECPQKNNFYSDQKEFKLFCFRLHKLINNIYDEI